MSSDNPLEVFFDLATTGAVLYAPVYDEHQELVDFRYVRLNPAGQRLLDLPAQPHRTFREYFPTSVPTGIFAWHRAAYLTGPAAPFDFPYAADGIDTFFRLVAQRSGELLVVNFTDMADLPRAAAEQALRDSRAAEQHARAEAERQQDELKEAFEQAPMAMAMLRGPEFLVEWANPRMGQIWGRPLRPLLGRPHFQALPDLAGQGFEHIFTAVFETGQPYDLQELLVHIEQEHRSYEGYFNITYQPLYEGVHITGILASALEVTDQVRARQQVQHLNEELAATNEELQAANNEYLATNTALSQAQQQLEHLNLVLETRVQERTSQLEAAQAATERQRRQWYKLFRHAPAGICIFDGPEWVYEFVNPGYQAMFPGRALLGKRLLDALPELADQPIMAILHRVYDTGEPFEASEVLVPLARTEGGPIEDIYFDLTYQARRNEAGQIDGFVTYAYDVTEQVLARRLREVERLRLERLLLEAPAAICILGGPDLIYELVNPGYQALFPGRELLGKPILAALPEIADNPVYTTFRQVYDTGHTHEEQALLIPLAWPSDGEWEDRYFKYIQQPRYAVDGRIDGILVFAFEVTEQVRVRQQVQALNEELQESNRQLTRTNVDLDTFVYTASHDLKAPITNIESIVQALRDTLPAAVQQDELIAHLLDLLNQTVTRFQFTIGQLTDISRLQLAHTGPAEPVGLATVVEAVRLDLAPAIVAADTRLTVEIAPTLLVSFSPANLRSIVYNLLSNAIKYRAPDRPSLVQVRAAQTAQAVVLTVQDNGLGMSELQQRQLFGLFQRLHTHVEGTGVGLYITKRLVENAGGTITVQSQPDAGTTFTVAFPL